jgi:hypothetical protein
MKLISPACAPSSRQLNLVLREIPPKLLAILCSAFAAGTRRATVGAKWMRGIRLPSAAHPPPPPPPSSTSSLSLRAPRPSPSLGTPKAPPLQSPTSAAPYRNCASRPAGLVPCPPASGSKRRAGSAHYHVVSRFNLLEGLDADKIKPGRTLDRDVWRGKKGSQLAERFYGRRSGETEEPDVDIGRGGVSGVARGECWPRSG